MKAIVVISLILYGASIFMLIRELYFYLKYDYNDSFHEIKFIGILINLTVLSIGAIYWLFTHNTTFHAIEVHLIHQGLWLGLLLWAWTMRTIALYSKRYRNIGSKEMK